MKREVTTTGNRRLAKKRVQWLNEALCFVSSFVVADSLVLRNRQLLVAAKRYLQGWATVLTSNICADFGRQNANASQN